jgi:hypothetical protein
MISVVRVEEDGNRGRSRHQFAEQLEPLWYQFIIEQAHTREVTAWTVEARDETKLDRVAPSNKDDGLGPVHTPTPRNWGGGRVA